MHVVLLGDSVFDNARYAAPEPDVTACLTEELEARVDGEVRVDLVAVDGAVTADVRGQLLEVPPGATHLVLSSGGNDALGSEHLMWESASRVADALERFAAPLDGFASRYSDAVALAAEAGLPLILCTIYDGDLPADEADPARLAVSLFDDIIYRTAERHQAAVVELRSVCTQAGDYVNAIEPSGQGGQKIARAVADKILR